MAEEKNELKSVLSELKKILADLKKEETAEQSKIQPEKQHPNTTESSPERPKSIPIVKKPAQRPIPVQPKQQIYQPQPETKLESEKPIKEPKPPELEQKQTTPVVPVEQKPIISEENLLRCALFYPPGQENSKETFMSNLDEIIRKTSKKPLVPHCIFEEPLETSTANWPEIIKKCQQKNVSAAFLVYSQDYDYSEIKNKFNSAGIFFHGILFSQLNKKITYIDLAVELILSKK